MFVYKLNNLKYVCNIGICRLFADKGFDQFGSLFGQVIIDNGDTKETFELNLPGVRTSRRLDEKITNDPKHMWSLMVACKDGFIVSLSAREVENENKYVNKKY